MLAKTAKLIVRNLALIIPLLVVAALVYTNWTGLNKQQDDWDAKCAQTSSHYDCYMANPNTHVAH